MVQAWPAALLMNECDLPVAHEPQWNFNHPLTRALVKMYQALEDYGIDVYSTPTTFSSMSLSL